MTRHYFEEDTPVEKEGGGGGGGGDERHIEPEDFYTYSNESYDSNERGVDGDGENDDYWCHREYMDRMNPSTNAILWEPLKIGKTLLHVCSSGVIRRAGDPFWCVTKGIPLTGTPYSYAMIETEDNVYKRFFIHHIVWKAFQGDVPPGWEVRHKPCVPMEYTREYPNDLGLLDIYPAMLPSTYASSSMNQNYNH